MSSTIKGCVVEYLKELDSMISGKVNRYGFILRYGRRWEYQPTKLDMTVGQCYYNALMCVLADPALTYCEGIAASYELGFPLDHAWCVTCDGMVVDPTWNDREGGDYFGVPFQTEWVRQEALRLGASGSYLDNWEEGWPLLVGKVKPEEFVNFELLEGRE